MESSSKFRTSMTISISLPSLCNTSAGIRNISDMRRQTFRKCILSRIYKQCLSSRFPLSLFPRRIWYGQFVLKFTQEERGMSQFDRGLSRETGSARSARSATRRLEKREESNGEATRRRGMRRKEQREEGTRRGVVAVISRGPE